MAIKLRCASCRKRLSVDEAFAGGLCRCPYCGDLTLVPGRGRRAAAAGRPTTPGGRPRAPGGRPEAPVRAGETRAPAADDIPTADPVKIQGVVALIVLGLVIAMATAGGIVLVEFGPDWFAKEPNAPAPPQRDTGGGRVVGNDIGPKRPSTTRQNGWKAAPREPEVTGPAVDGMVVKTPVVYCIASGSPTAFNFAVAKVLKSLETLRPGDSFAVVVCRPAGVDSPAEGYLSGPEGIGKVQAYFDETVAGSYRTLVKGIEAAAVRMPPPRTIVIFSSGGVPPAELKQAIDAAAGTGATVNVVILTDDPAAIEQLKALAEDPRIKGQVKTHRPREWEF